MVKPVSLESIQTNQFSEMASTNVRANEAAEVDKSSIVSEQSSTQATVKENNDVQNIQEIQAQKTEKESAEEIEQAFAEISEFMNVYNRNVNFSMDEKSEKTVIKVFDSDSQELIKQFPSEDLIKLAQKIRELRQDVDLKSGIFLDEKI